MEPLDCKLSALAIEVYCSISYCWEGDEIYPVGVLHHYIFIISRVRLTSHMRSKVVLLDTGTPGTSRKMYSEDVDGETRTHNSWITNTVH